MTRAMFHVKHEASLPALDLGQAEALDRYEALLRTRALPAGMISGEDASRLRERHLDDSLRAAAAVTTSDREAYDLGSGAGLPGVVVAIARPDLHVTLVERRRNRAAFLELVVDELHLPNASVFLGDLERLGTAVDVVFARALAPIARSWGLAEPLLGPGGRLVYFAGIGFDPRTDLPEGVDAIVMHVALAPSGPLVIMARQ